MRTDLPPAIDWPGGRFYTGASWGSPQYRPALFADPVNPLTGGPLAIRLLMLLFHPERASADEIERFLLPSRRRAGEAMLERIRSGEAWGAVLRCAGPRGSGKSHVLAYVRDRLEAAGQPVAYLVEPGEFLAPEDHRGHLVFVIDTIPLRAAQSSISPEDALYAIARDYPDAAILVVDRDERDSFLDPFVNEVWRLRALTPEETEQLLAAYTGIDGPDPWPGGEETRTEFVFRLSEGNPRRVLILAEGLSGANGSIEDAMAWVLDRYGPELGPGAAADTVLGRYYSRWCAGGSDEIALDAAFLIEWIRAMGRARAGMAAEALETSPAAEAALDLVDLTMGSGAAIEEELKTGLASSCTLFQRGAFPAALAAFGEILLDAPHRIEAWAGRAASLYALAQYEDAVIAAEEIVQYFGPEVDADQVDAVLHAILFQMAVWNDLGRPEEAAELYELLETLEERLDSVRFTEALARALIVRAKYRALRSDFDAALETLHEALNRLGTGNLPKRLSDVVVEIRLLESECLIAAGDDAGALEAIEHALTFAPADPLSLALQFELLCAAGQIDAALETLERSYSEQDTPAESGPVLIENLIALCAADPDLLRRALYVFRKEPETILSGVLGYVAAELAGGRLSAPPCRTCHDVLVNLAGGGPAAQRLLELLEMLIAHLEGDGSALEGLPAELRGDFTGLPGAGPAARPVPFESAGIRM